MDSKIQSNQAIQKFCAIVCNETDLYRFETEFIDAYDERFQKEYLSIISEVMNENERNLETNSEAAKKKSKTESVDTYGRDLGYGKMVLANTSFVII